MKNSGFIVTLVIFIASLHTSCGVAYKKKRYVKRNYKEIKKSFPEAQVSLIQDSIKVIFPNNVVFDVGSSTLKEGFQTKIVRFAQILNRYNRTNILITGHTDNSGAEESNLKLSLERADQVKSRLISENIDKIRLFTWGLGEKNPIATNESEEGRAKNRRVEFVVLYNAELK